MHTLTRTLLLLPTLLLPALPALADPWTMPASTIPAPRDLAFPGTLRIDVDASDTTRRIVRVKQRVPVPAAGRLTLLYPQWDKGSHGPTVEVSRLAGLVIEGGGRRLAWRRDPLDAHAFHIDVPAGTREIALAFQYLAPLGARSPVSPDLIDLQWQNLVLYPAGWFARRIPVAASLTLPAGMTAGSSLVQRPGAGATIVFEPVALDLLLDSPVLAAPHVERRSLVDGPVPVRVSYFAAKPGQLDGAAGMDAPLRAVIRQTAAVFGAPPFPHFDYLVPLTERLPGPGGLEHIRAAEIVMPPDFLQDRQASAAAIDLFAHEYVHAWNGKFAQPKDHWTPTPNVPMQSSMLWVYEGQSEFWGRVIAARAGLRSVEDTLDALALDAAAMAHRPGRQWKSLADSALDPVTMPGGVGVVWQDWQRRKDYYAEGVLLWLDIDGLLRERSEGRHGMDDFASRFFAVRGQGGQGDRRYTLDDVCATLAGLAPLDWRRYLEERLQAHGDAGLLDGLARAGYRLVYTDAPSAYVQRALQGEGVPDFSYSIGIEVNDKGMVRAVGWDSPAFRAGLAPGMRIAEVAGAPFSVARLAAAIAAREPAGIALGVESDKQMRALAVTYDGGMRYPKLERIPEQPERLKSLLRPR
jgi:predicted metalloprotease with PDZ domain